MEPRHPRHELTPLLDRDLLLLVRQAEAEFYLSPHLIQLDARRLEIRGDSAKGLGIAGVVRATRSAASRSRSSVPGGAGSVPSRSYCVSRSTMA